jgi:hypothetical protein
MKLLSIILQEAKQVGILYHNTTARNALEIVQKNKLKATSNDRNNLIDFRTKEDDYLITPWGPMLKDREKYPPYVSFTRNKNYKRTPHDVTFIIDGDKLSNNYKIVPYSHFGVKTMDESEQRIYKDLTPLDNYLIGILLPFEKVDFKLELESLLREKNLPYKIRTDLNN